MLAAVQATYAIAMGHHPKIDLDAVPMTHVGRTSARARLGMILTVRRGIQRQWHSPCEHHAALQTQAKWTRPAAH